MLEQASRELRGRATFSKPEVRPTRTRTRANGAPAGTDGDGRDSWKLSAGAFGAADFALQAGPGTSSQCRNAPAARRRGDRGGTGT